MYDCAEEHRLANLPSMYSLFFCVMRSRLCHSTFSSCVTSFFFSFCVPHTVCQSLHECGCLFMFKSHEEQRKKKNPAKH